MAQTIDGITVDFNRLTRKEFRAVLAQFDGVTANTPESDDLSGELVERVITVWPFDVPISKEGYINLGLEDGKRVDDAVTAAMAALSQKK